MPSKNNVWVSAITNLTVVAVGFDPGQGRGDGLGVDVGQRGQLRHDLDPALDLLLGGVARSRHPQRLVQAQLAPRQHRVRLPQGHRRRRRRRRRRVGRGQGAAASGDALGHGRLRPRGVAPAGAAAPPSEVSRESELYSLLAEVLLIGRDTYVNTLGKSYCLKTLPVHNTGT